MIRILVVCACSAPLMLFAADPWKAKKASEWTEKDATRILTNSPWAKTVSAEIDLSRMQGMPGGPDGMGGPPPGGGPGGPGGAGGPGMGGPPTGGMAGGPGGMEAPKFLVRWESAAPIREATAKTEDANGAKLTELSKEYYVISVTGTASSPGMRDPQRGGMQPDFSRMAERMKDAASLILHGRDKIAPANVESIETAGGRTILFLFPRSRSIDADDKDVVFETSMGPMALKSKFVLKDMIYDSRIAL